ncbi:glycosyltransferase [Desulfosporosinus acidiphilus SJ4]|uniref:Glycosyltransferase n=2 Tax=Desulfosporosinus TaxID=79206 RepID=I4DBG0_DESAJ|nr:glycosyltransferase [Desulfosporosinus acidiphilus SJ4]
MCTKMTEIEKQHVFIIGSKGIPARYGGFETFVEKLTLYQKSPDIQYHVSCLVDDNEKLRTFSHNGAKCFDIKGYNIGPAKAIFYDVESLKYCLAYIKSNKIQHPIIYVLACRIGPFIGYYKAKIEKLGGRLYVNPDGHEWKRAKWNALVRRYWRISEMLMVKYSDVLICDSKNIQKYIKTRYKKFNPNTTFIAYGSETTKSKLMDDDQKVVAWYQNKNVRPHEYYLVVGRFVPENNYETIIREFMRSNTDKDIVIITEIRNNPFYDKLKLATGFENDKRIKFVGTVYEQQLLTKIRENAYGYIHGHEVGGTNPSLLEALGSTDLNLLLDVGFNREVGEDGAIYWMKEDMSLAKLIDVADKMSPKETHELSTLARKRINDCYGWEYIIERYESIFFSYFIQRDEVTKNGNSTSSIKLQ